jgi:hypothetical protein
VKKNVLYLCIVILLNLSLLAQAGQPRIVHGEEKSAIHVPPQEAPATLKAIYRNLGVSKTDLYLDNRGWVVAGPNSSQDPESIGMPFIPKSASHVLQVRVALQYGGSGANQINLNLYDDAGGVPGTLLAGPVTVTDLPDYGTCCTLAIANFSSVAVSGGAQYWVVADTPLTGAGSDSFGLWDFVIATIPVAATNGSVWELIDGDLRPAGEVLGTIP